LTFPSTAAAMPTAATPWTKRRRVSVKLWSLSGVRMVDYHRSKIPT